MMKKIISVVLILLIWINSAYGALSTAIQWEVRTAGSNTNGGGFKAGASGTDWTQQNGAKYAVADAVTNGTTTITSATANFGTDVVGNVLYIAGGTAPITAGWYEITARTDAQTITVDRSTGLAAGTGATLNIGGALQTIATVVSIMVDDNVAWVRNDGTYTITSAIALSTAHATQYRTRIVGYQTTRGDAAIGGTGTRPTINQTAAANGITVSGTGWWVENFVLDGAIAGVNTGLIGLSIAASYFIDSHVRIVGWANEARTTSGNYHGSLYLEATNCGTTSVTTAIVNETGLGSWLYAPYVHDNIRTGTQAGTTVSVASGVFANNSGATSDGLVSAGYGNSIAGNLFYANGRDGHRRTLAGTFGHASPIVNNIFANNGGYGLNITTAQTTKDIATVHGNAYYNNTSGTVNGINLSSDDIDLGSAVANNPFINGASADWRLNNTGTGGGLLRTRGFPAHFPGLPSISNAPDIGPYQAGGMYNTYFRRQ